MKYALLAALLCTMALMSCTDDDSVVNSASADTSETDPIINPSPAGTSAIESAFVRGGDITNALATSRSGDCTTYANTYTSNVTDLNTGRNFSGDVSIIVSGSKCVFWSNGIPNHDMGEGTSFPNTISRVNQTYTIPSSPTIASSPTTNIWKNSVILLNGGVIDLLPAACYDVGNEPLGSEKIGCGPDQLEHPWRYNVMSSLNTFRTDTHNAHVQPNGLYHYHANPMAMFETDCSSTTGASPVVGFAADGFPVYGSCISENGSIRSIHSSYQLKDGGGPRQGVSGYTTPTAGTGSVDSANYDGQFRGDYEYVAGSGDLDECNGMTVDGQYGYYITDSFPYVLNCFSGTPDATW